MSVDFHYLLLGSLVEYSVFAWPFDSAEKVELICETQRRFTKVVKIIS